MTDPAGHVTTYEYDAGNRMVKTIFDDDSFIEVEYYAEGRKLIEYSQCLPGNESQRVKTKYLYDAAGKLTGVINDFEGPEEIETSYEYDEAGNKTAQTVPNRNTTRWACDDLGRVSKKTLPEMMSEHFTYFPSGNVETKTDFNADTTRYNYHQCCGRLESKNYPDGTSVSYTYTNTGRVDEVTDTRGVTDHDYDFRGRLTSVSNPDGTSLSYTYQPNGNRETVTANPSGKTTTYRYDDLNRLQYVIDPDNRQTMYTYDDAGNRKTVAYPNGVMTEYTYDDLNRLEYMENRLTGGGEIISSYDYVLRDDGNRTDVYEHNGREVHYTYDRLNRLTEEYIIDPTNGEERINYTYDAFGNRATKTDSTGTTVYKYDANDRLLFEIGPEKTISYKYDANGNTIEKSDGVETTTYTYDFENRLVSAQTPGGFIEYEYDHDGIRVGSSIDGNVTRYLVDKNRDYAQVMEERDSAGALVVSYVYGDDLVSQDRGGVSFYVYDGQLSTRQLTDISGVVTDSYVYDAFGVLTDRSGITKNNYLYTGEQYDPNNGFYYLRARYYNQFNGRFLTIDLWGGNVFEPVSLHRYQYANSNPIMFYDPSGLITGKVSEFNLSDGIQQKLRQIKNNVVKNLYKRPKQAMRNILCSSAKGMSRREAPLHHIATNKHLTHWTERFQRDIFDRGGLNLNYWANKLRVPNHSGRHRNAYHEEVYNFLMGKVDDAVATGGGMGLAGSALQDFVADSITDGLLDIANGICNKQGRWHQLLM